MGAYSVTGSKACGAGIDPLCQGTHVPCPPIQLCIHCTFKVVGGVAFSQELGLSGVQIGSHINRWDWDRAQPGPAEVWDLDAEELRCVFAAAEELGAAILVHPWNMDQSKRMSRFWMPWLVGECSTCCTCTHTCSEISILSEPYSVYM